MTASQAVMEIQMRTEECLVVAVNIQHPHQDAAMVVPRFVLLTRPFIKMLMVAASLSKYRKKIAHQFNAIVSLRIPALLAKLKLTSHSVLQSLSM